LATAEAKLSPQVRAKFALFDGIVKVDANHGAPHGAKPAGGHAPGGTRHQPRFNSPTIGDPMTTKTLIIAAALLAGTAYAQTVDVKDAWVRTSVPGQKATGAFMKLTAKDGAKLVAASSPVAGVTEVHEMKMEGDVMKMKAVAGGLDLPAGKTVELKPGGYHVMLMDLKAALPKDSTIPLTLVFKDAKGVESRLELKVPVAAAPMAAAHKH
jgi:copper(I)-binding protein